MRKEKNRYGDEKTGIPILVTKLEEVKQPCKQCGKEEREQGSSRGRKCSDGYKGIKFAQSRLMKKISQAGK